MRSSAGRRRLPAVSVVPTATSSYAAHASYMHVWAIASARATIGGPFRNARLRRTSASAAAFQSLTTVACAEVSQHKGDGECHSHDQRLSPQRPLQGTGLLMVGLAPVAVNCPKGLRGLDPRPWVIAASATARSRGVHAPGEWIPDGSDATESAFQITRATRAIARASLAPSASCLDAHARSRPVPSATARWLVSADTCEAVLLRRPEPHQEPNSSVVRPAVRRVELHPAFALSTSAMSLSA